MKYTDNCIHVTATNKESIDTNNFNVSIIFEIKFQSGQTKDRTFIETSVTFIAFIELQIEKLGGGFYGKEFSKIKRILQWD